MNEHALTKKVTAWLATQPDVWWLKVHGGSPYQRAGVPDLILCVRGLFAAVELKAPDNPSAEPSPTQRAQLKAIRRAGGATIDDARSLDEVKSLVESLRRVADSCGLG